MGKNIIQTVTFVDDLKGTEFEEGQGETITYSFDGTNYEIDLTNANAEAFRKAMSKYVAASRVVTGRKSGNGGRTDLTEVREWARGNGFEVSDRGRVSQAVLTAFDRFHAEKED